jgi:cbb3-type cytochrome oxidase maturation protein
MAGNLNNNMIVIFILIPVSIVIASCFLIAFIWAVRSGQFEDTATPAMRLLVDEKNLNTAASSSSKKTNEHQR